jgi:hypothetical protein
MHSWAAARRPGAWGLAHAWPSAAANCSFCWNFRQHPIDSPFAALRKNTGVAHTILLRTIYMPAVGANHRIYLATRRVGAAGRALAGFDTAAIAGLPTAPATTIVAPVGN